MPGVERLSTDLAVQEVRRATDLGIRAIALFPAVTADRKTPEGEEACNPDNLICRAIRTLKDSVPETGIITDVALDPYTSHGHDGLLKNGAVLNDETIDTLVRQSVVHAQAGADIIAPSDMMDGRVGKIRAALDAAGYENTMILSYAAKYASAFYGPFRGAVGSDGVLKGDKKTYQMNPANAAEALREVALDIREGADSRIKETFKMPTFAYHVSGEYAMLKAAAAQGWLTYEDCLHETLLAFKRAGTDAILTYGARDMAKILENAG
jgi:porphobilinogen synthase